MPDSNNSTPRTKSHIVFFRLAAEEYDMMKRASEASGQRSISALARLAVRFWMERHQSSGGVGEDELQCLHSRFVNVVAELRGFMARQRKAGDRCSGGQQ